MRFMMFSKSLQSMSVLDAGKTVKSLGFDGIELTVRGKAHVPPNTVRDALPRAVDQLREIGLDVPALVTEVHSLQDEYAYDVCATAARVGARLLRTSPHRYTPFGTIREQIAAARRAAADLEKLAREHGVMFCIQTHSGNMLGGQGGIVDQILQGTDPRYVGVSLDPGHLTVEGGGMGWMQSIDLLQDRIGMVDAKSFGWFNEPDGETGEMIWVHKKLPLARGNVPWRQVFALLRQVGWDADGRALVSLGSEYQSGAWRDLTVPELIDQTREDLAHIRRQAELAAQPDQPPPGNKRKQADQVPA
jgi:sugar phosphate isomerase/epimerase